MSPVAITITAGDTAQRLGGMDYRVSKIELISTLEARLHSKSLRIAAELADGPALGRELKDFRRNVTAAGRATFAARVGRHDDLVLATALPLWWLENRPAPPRVVKLRGVF